MKLLISPQLSVRRAAQRRVLYDLSNSQTTHQELTTSICRHRRFSSTPSKYNQAPTSKQQNDSSISHKIRLLMRRIPHPVAIVTASSPSRSPSKPIPRGMTVSSFNTVTLHPSPIITFNVRQPSETLAALQSSRRFLVHILSPTASMAKLARTFSRGNENVELDRFEFTDYEIEIENQSILLPRLSRRRDKHDVDENIEGKEGADFIFILECEYLPDKSVQVCDHMIVLGDVRRIIAPCGAIAINEEGGRHAKEDFCLMYADTRFWGMGEETS